MPAVPRAVRTAAFVALLVASQFCARAQGPGLPPPFPAGTRAPSFLTQTIQGKPLALSALRGKVVLLDYWATWCGPCRMATPTLKALYQEFHRRGFTVIGMSVDDSSTAAQVKPFVQALHIPYPITVSPVANSRAAQSYKVDGIPSQYLIDKRGIVRWSQSGFAPGEGTRLAATIRKLLAEPGRLQRAAIDKPSALRYHKSTFFQPL